MKDEVLSLHLEKPFCASLGKSTGRPGMLVLSEWTRSQKEQVAGRDREFIETRGFHLALNFDPAHWGQLPSSSSGLHKNPFHALK